MVEREDFYMVVVDVTREKLAAEGQRVMNELEATGNHICFNFHDVRTGYYSDETDSISWLSRYFEGFFHPSTEAEMHAVIYSTSDPALYTLLQMHHHLLSSKNDYLELALSPQTTLIHKKCKETSPQEDVYCILQKQERKLLLV